MQAGVNPASAAGSAPLRSAASSLLRWLGLDLAALRCEPPVLSADQRDVLELGELIERSPAAGFALDIAANDVQLTIALTGDAAQLPAAYAASTVTVSAAVQPEGVQRAVLEAQAMERPVIVSDLAAGGERRIHRQRRPTSTSRNDLARRVCRGH